MKRVLLGVWLITVVIAGVSAAADGGRTGLGIIVGEPTGVSFKQWLGGGGGIVAGVAWSFEGNDDFHFHLDFVRHSNIRGSSNDFRLPVYYGIGGRIKLEDNRDDRLGLRIPLGVHLYYESVPIDFFFEAVPLMDLSPETDFDINLALGARFYFN